MAMPFFNVENTGEIVQRYRTEVVELVQFHQAWQRVYTARMVGSFCWMELATSDQSAAKNFYSLLFGWEPKDHPGIGVQAENGAFGWTVDRGKEDYLHIRNGDRYVGGIPPVREQPPRWLLYFQVADCEASTAKAKEAGANVFMGPMTIEKVGTMTVLADPQGAVFALIQL
jgi:hypothetical protein